MKLENDYLEVIMKYMRILIIVLIALGCALPSGRVFGQEYPDIGAGVAPPEFERVGNAAWQFLKIPSNARMVGLGGIISNIYGTNDASASFTNPAALSDIENLSVSLNTQQWIADISYQSAAVFKQFGNVGGFGLNMIYLDYGNMQRTANEIIDRSPQVKQVRPNLDLGTFSAYDMMVGLSYTRQISSQLQFGTNIKFLQEKLDDATTSAFAIDIGTVYYTGIRSFRIAMLGRNFGPDAAFSEFEGRIALSAAKLKLPMTFVLGGAIDILEGNDSPHKWTLASEFIHTNDASEKINLGTEYSFMDIAYLRGGYRFNYDEEGLTLGGGLNINAGGFSARVDYSYMDFGRLGDISMISVVLGM